MRQKQDGNQTSTREIHRRERETERGREGEGEGEGKEGRVRLSRPLNAQSVSTGLAENRMPGSKIARKRGISRKKVALMKFVALRNWH